MYSLYVRLPIMFDEGAISMLIKCIPRNFVTDNKYRNGYEITRFYISLCTLIKYNMLFGKKEKQTYCMTAKLIRQTKWLHARKFTVL